jgi:hypothetical protein
VPVRLPPSGAVVIALSFRVRGGCPGATELAARVVFEDGGRIVHADSSQLADLSALRFPGCSRRVAFRGAAGRQRRLYD